MIVSFSTASSMRRQMETLRNQVFRQHGLTSGISLRFWMILQLSLECRQTSLERRNLHSEEPLPFHKMTKCHQRANAIADDLGDRKHRR